jgi:hypothetical protein
MRTNTFTSSKHYADAKQIAWTWLNNYSVVICVFNVLIKSVLIVLIQDLKQDTDSFLPRQKRVGHISVTR